MSGSKKLFEKDIHTASKHMTDALERYLKLPIGRRVRDSYDGVGTVREWKPIGHGMTDAFIAFDNGREIMCSLRSMKPADGKGPLPSRRAATKLAEVSRDLSMHAIANRWHGTEAPAVPEIVKGRAQTPTFSLSRRPRK